MKKHLLTPFILIILICFSSLTLFSQAPEGIIYQAEARDSKGHTIHNKNLDIKITILADYPSGPPVWEGYHNVTTDNHGLFTLTIGEGTGGTYVFTAIDWANHSHFLNVQVYYKNTWSDMGTTQLVSVPYALHAKTAGSALSSIESDPVFQASSAFWISSFDISMWNQAVYWGDHSLAGYLTNYSETDPIFIGSSAHDIAFTDIANWNSAYGWGNHADVGYLTHFTESDPVFSLTPAAGIAAGDIVNWNTALSWGNHATSGYLTNYSETDPIFSPSPAAGITSEGIGNWNTAFGWGDHSTAGYLTSYTETDPLWTASMPDYYTKNELMTPGASQVDWYNLSSRPDGLDDGDDIEDDDADPTNELQALTLNSNTLSLTKDATTVDLTEYLDNTDEQQLSLEGNVLSLDNSADVVLNVDDADADPENELQDWTTLPDIPADIADGDDIEDADADETNELLTGVSIDNTTLIISDAGGIYTVDLGLIASGGVISLEALLNEDNSANFNRIEDLANPIQAQDAATKYYVDKLEAKLRTLEQALLLSGLQTAIDVDKNTYEAISIGGQTWMTENLKTTKLNDGTPLEFPETGGWRDPPGYTLYPGGFTGIGGSHEQPVPWEDYWGGLYNYQAVETGKLCPSGWRVATDSDWKQLEFFLGMEMQELDQTGGRGENEGIGTKLKSKDHWEHWPLDPSLNNESGFTGFPGGLYNGIYEEINTEGYWWAPGFEDSPGGPVPTFFDRRLSSRSAGIERHNLGAQPDQMLSVRCVKDEGDSGCFDFDGDGFGEGLGCLGPDCDDQNQFVNPAAAEVDDHIDNDCDGQIDEIEDER